MFVKHRILRLCLDKLLKIKTYQAIDSEFQFCKNVLKVVSMHFFFCINSESWSYVKLKFHKYLEKIFSGKSGSVVQKLYHISDTYRWNDPYLDIGQIYHPFRSNCLLYDIQSRPVHEHKTYTGCAGILAYNST